MTLHNTRETAAKNIISSQNKQRFYHDKKVKKKLFQGVSGKVLLRSIMNSSADSSWDEPLPPDHFEEWDTWRTSLKHIETVSLPRMYLPTSLTK